MPPRKNPNEPYYKNSLPTKWQQSYLKASQYTFDSIIQDAFYVAHGRIQFLLENYGKFNKQAQNLLDLAEALADPTNEDIPEAQRISPEFLHEVKLLLLGLTPDALVRNLNSTIALADGAQRLALNDSGSVVKQLEICKTLLINILKYSNDIETKQLVLSTITQLKLEAGLPIEELESILEQLKNEQTPESSEQKEVNLEEDVWTDENR